MKFLAIALILLSTLCNAQNFFTTERKVVTAGLIAESAYDGYTTQVLLSRGYGELNPLARPLVVQGATGQVVASALGVGVVLGAQYTLHKLHHERAANWIGRIALAGEGANCIRQGQLGGQR